MSKFPDPSKSYEAQPVNSSTVFQAPPNEAANNPPPSFPPPSSSPPTPTPIISDLPSELSLSPSPFRNLIPIVLGIIALVVIGLLIFRFLPNLLGNRGSATNITLTYWGLWEPPSVFQTVIADYEKEHPNIKINYVMQSPKGYRSRLQTAIGSGSGPDIARIHNTWMPMLKKQLAPAPSTLNIDTSDYYPVILKNFLVGNSFYAMPLGIDGLALYYNPALLEASGVEVPSDWNALRKIALDLTKRNPTTGIIEKAGMSLGTSNNVDHWSDILALLILQNSGDPSKPSDQSVQDAITFFTLFSVSDKSWDVSQPNSTYAFATGTTAMMLAPSWRIPEIKSINPTLDFKVVEAPKLPTTNLAWATYWAEAVPVSSKYQKESWEFLQYLGSPDVLQKLYLAQAQLRGVGEPYPRKSMASLLQDDPLAYPFISQADNYTSWHLSSLTHDEGLNDELIKYYEDAVNSIVGGSSVSSIIKTLDAGVTQILAKYPEAK